MPALARVQAWIRKHRVVLLAGGGAAVAAVALYLRQNQRTATASPSVHVPATTGTGASMPGYYTSGGMGAGGYYDSTATDVYNAIMPQLEALHRQLSEVVRPGPVASPPAPVGPVATPTGPTPLPPAAAQLPPGAGDSWDTWQRQQLATGQLVTQPGQLDWGVIARSTLPATATRSDVYFRSLELQKKYPAIHTQYPMYVPVSVASGIR